MSDFENAPWNKPVEEDGRELRDEEIPSRREKRDQHDDERGDPLTDLIFSTVSFEKGFEGELLVPEEDDTQPDPLSQEIFSGVGTDDVVNNAPTKNTHKVEEPQKEKSKPVIDKDALKARLAYYEKREQELRARLTSAGALPAESQIRNLKTSPAPQNKNQKMSYVARPDSLSSSRVTVRSDDTLTERSTNDTRWGRRFFLAGLALFAIAGGVWGLLRTGTLSPTSEFLSNIGEFFNSSSFVADQVGASDTFTPLFLLREKTVALKGTYDDKERLTKALDEFFSVNTSFSWLNIFRPEDVRADGALFAPTRLSLLEDVAILTQSLERKSGASLSSQENDVGSYIAWLSFLEQLLSEDGRYLVLTGMDGRPAPAGSEPRFYGELVIKNNSVEVERFGSVTDLNAALTAKITPPRAVQVVKTGLDIPEAMWFLDFETAGEIVTDLYRQTTQRTVDGVFLFSAETVRRLVKAEGIAASPDSADWLPGLLQHLSVSRAEEYSSFANILGDSFKRHELQAYFVDNKLASFVRKKELATTASFTTKDALAVGVRSWEGGGILLELVEHEPTFFTDGSVLARVRTHLINNDNETRRVYIKTYVPYGSFVLGREGFSSRQPTPAFDYGAQGFSVHSAVTSLKETMGERFSNLDFFKEGEYLAVGGWAEIPAAGRHAVVVEYRLPERLAWQRGEDNYSLEVARSGAFSEFPFRFTASFDKGVTFTWRDPEGFLTNETAEYQQTLTENLTLLAELKFEKTNDETN